MSEFIAAMSIIGSCTGLIMFGRKMYEILFVQDYT